MMEQKYLKTARTYKKKLINKFKKKSVLGDCIMRREYMYSLINNKKEA